MKILVIIPTFNEVESIGAVVQELLTSTHDLDILVVDDHSPDGTVDVIGKFVSPRVHLLERSEKMGLGSAYRSGFTWALDRTIFTHIVSMDGDGSHQVSDLSAMIALAASGAQVVLGTRWMPGGGITRWSWHRKLLSKSGTIYARLALNLPYRDLTGGFRIYSTNAIRQIRMEAISSEGYCFQIEMVRALSAADIGMEESPITFVERSHGQSKMKSVIVREALIRVSLWSIERRLKPNADKLHYVK